MSSADDPRPTLGIVAICYDEERDLPGFFANHLPWVDEIVLIDDGSTDRTAEIAEGAGSKVKFCRMPREEGEFYAHQRNKGIDVAESDWLLHMDIDERVPAGLRDEILDAICAPGFDAYRYRRLNYFLHRPMGGGGWASWNEIHLARNAALRFSGMFHEACEVNTSPERIGQLCERMHHFNDESFEERLRKSDVYRDEIVEGVEGSGEGITIAQVMIAPLREFVARYFLKRGFMDGAPGMISALHAFSAYFRAYAIVWDRQHRISRDDLERDLQGEGGRQDS